MKINSDLDYVLDLENQRKSAGKGPGNDNFDE